MLHTYPLVCCNHLTPQTTCVLSRCSFSMSHLMTLHLPMLILFPAILFVISTPSLSRHFVLPSTYPISRYPFLRLVPVSLSPIPLTAAPSSPLSCFTSITQSALWFSKLGRFFSLLLFSDNWSTIGSVTVTSHYFICPHLLVDRRGRWPSSRVYPPTVISSRLIQNLCHIILLYNYYINFN